ncbi:sensor histidine kinase [Thermus sediminis]|uniref:sensor histidine kinase n=1 Tax=Thermus sediminis TaxID=1761908 RepID=UPI000E3C5824|nr:HAMP domain-containing sensor histidine kinase [Thermus sediminis]
MATAFFSLRGRLFALLLLSLLLLLVPLAFTSVKEAEKAAAEDLKRALFTRLFLLGEEAPEEEEALLLELFRLGQTFGGGVGFLVRGEEARFTQVEAWPLSDALFAAIKEGRPYQEVWRGALYVALPREGLGFGLAVPLEGVSRLGERLLFRYAAFGGGLFLLVLLLAYLALAWALRPLARLEGLLRVRSPEDLRPLPEPPLMELRPVVGALNALFARVAGLLRELSEKEALARRFAQHASHELRTPLAALKGYLEVLRRKPEPRALEGALREAARLEARLSGLLRLSQLESASSSPKPLDLRAFLAEMGVEAEGEGRALADPELLALAVENVLENARRHGKPPVRAFLEREGGGVWLWLVDSGPGFPESLLPWALEPFAHGGKGTGLGLALVAAVARLHGGKARAENRGGAAVGLFLPLASLKVSPGAPFGEGG